MQYIIISQRTVPKTLTLPVLQMKRLLDIEMIDKDMVERIELKLNLKLWTAVGEVYLRKPPGPPSGSKICENDPQKLSKVLYLVLLVVAKGYIL